MDTPITVTILNKDSERYLAEVLDSVRGFDEVLILDTGSTDRSLEIAQAYPNVRIEHAAFTGFGPLHNKMVDLASHEWILSLDSDEVLTSELFQEIASTPLDTKTVYAFPRHNLYNGRHIRGCGWHPDVQYRLFHRGTTRFTEALVHETVNRTGLPTKTFKHPIRHYSYASTEEFLAKMQKYSSLFAADHAGKKSSGLFTAIGHGLFTFFKSYVLKRGFLDGAEGFVISVYNANTAFYKYLKLQDANRKQSTK